MGRKARSIGVFTCCICRGDFAAMGGNSASKCDACKAALGLSPRRIAQMAAHTAVAKAIKSGALTRPAEFPCVDCGVPAIEYDHRDYNKPLKVVPVCRRCNLLRGAAKFTQPQPQPLSA